jgi:hypothetical protein
MVTIARINIPPEKVALREVRPEHDPLGRLDGYVPVLLGHVHFQPRYRQQEQKKDDRDLGLFGPDYFPATTSTAL